VLKAEDNEILTRVGPGTLMGELLRRYWTPACLTAEVPGPESAPARVRLLGESLVAFRDTAGRVGLVQENCPHRAQEQLGSTDRAITRMRHILLSAAKGLAAGKEPPAVGEHDYRSIFGAEKVLAPGEDWRLLATPADPTFAEALSLATGQPTS